jgi:ATP-dependent Clp protease ATP-binding subunit ClpA
MKFNKNTSEIFISAFQNAKSQNCEYITPEHILYSTLENDEGIDLIKYCGGNIERLKKSIKEHIDNDIPKVKSGEPMQSEGFERVLSNAFIHMESAGVDEIQIGDIIAAIFDEEESYARYFLQLEGITKLDVLNYISHGKPTDMSDEEVPDENIIDESRESFEGQKKESKGKFLSQFAIDITQRAINNELDPLIGREDIISRTLQVLCRRQKNNPVHVGDPGVGKTAITEGLAQMIVGGKVPKLLKDSKIFMLDLGGMLAGTRYRGDFEERLKKVLNEIQKYEKAIVYIDEIHNIVGAGAVSGGSMDASNILKPFLLSGKMRFIGSTTYDEYKKFFEKDRALTRRFQKIEISEPDIDDAIKILQGLKDRYEKHHNVKYTDEAIKSACELSAKYIHDRFLPDKAIDVIDEAGSFARLNDETDETITIDEHNVEKIVSLIARIPEKSVNENEIIKLKDLENDLKKTIYGQDDAIVKVVRSIKASRAGFHDQNKPVSSLLFIGQTGVGKTELARQIALNMGISLLRFDMSEYQEKHSVARLIGSPPGYVGYDEGGLLTESIRKTPYCVLLLDEIEKAHEDIFNVLLQVMDYATLTDNTGRKADFKNVILILTSNAGAKEAGRVLSGFGNRKNDNGTAMLREVERIFTPEFRNRLDGIIVFNPLDEMMAERIARKAIDEFESRLKEKNISIRITDACIKKLAGYGLSSDFGAREINRVVQEKVKSFFVDEVLFGKLSDGGTAQIDIDATGEIVIKVEEK